MQSSKLGIRKGYHCCQKWYKLYIWVRGWARLHKTPVTVKGIRTCTRNLSELH